MDEITRISTHASIGGDIRIHGLSSRSIERLRLAFTLQNPVWLQAKIYSRADGIPEYVEYLVEHPDGSIILPRGGISIIRRTLLKDNIELRFTQNFMTSGDPISIPEKDFQPLRKFQQEALDSALKHHQGIIIIPCGGGKTRLGVFLIKSHSVKSLVIVPTEDILDQWVKEIKHHLDLDCGIISGGNFTDGPIIIALDRSLGAIGKYSEILQRVGLILVDECHHVPCVTLQNILPFCPAKKRIGLTATYTRGDRLERVIDWSFGEKLFEISVSDLVDLGHLILPKLEVINTDFKFIYDGPDKKKGTELHRRIREDSKRNQLICDVVHKEVSNGEYVALLSNDKAHCRLLGRMLSEMGLAPVILTGQTNKKFRKDSIQNMRDGKLQLIIATSLFDEGVDIQRVSKAVFAWPQKAPGKTQQKAGRIMRPFYGKAPKIYDFVDKNVESLVRRFYERKRVYREIGISI